MRTRWHTKQEAEKKLPDPNTGVVCECGHKYPFTGYVFAHWREIVTSTCDVCGRKYESVCGISKCVHTPMTVPGAKNKL